MRNFNRLSLADNADLHSGKQEPGRGHPHDHRLEERLQQLRVVADGRMLQVSNPQRPAYRAAFPPVADLDLAYDWLGSADFVTG